MKKVIFYTNQFFGQLGGEDKADIEPIFKEGAVGTASLLEKNIRNAEIISTIICGDNYYAEKIEEAKEKIMDYIKANKPDIFIAGPAFNAGRFGVACGSLCAEVEKKLGIPTLTGLYLENPAVELYRDKTLIVEVGKSAAHMKEAISKMQRIANKLISDDVLGLPEEEGYIPRGIRVNVFKDKTGAQRALDMLVDKLKGNTYKTEIPIPTYETIEAATELENLEEANIALITTGGIVPFGNPDHLPAATAKYFKKYDVSHIDVFTKGEFESVHAGYDPVYANEDPNRVAPLDILREYEKKGKIGKLHEYFITTTGNSTSVADATRMGMEIALHLKESGVNGVILTST